ncbi:MAG: hypothetical protein O3A00_15860 [Planctomycetota bacterium]|nr:hypothetical protein [Planctomycetota bacterium]
MRKILCSLLVLASSVASAQDQRVSRVLAKFDRLRPSEKDLAMYRLDWADSLDNAWKRAAREGRPVFLVIIHAKYGDIQSGHC